MRIRELRTLYTEERIARRVREMADEINAAYAGKPLVLLCVLTGAFMFFSDLAKRITVKPEIDFVRMSSYGNCDSSSGVISFTKDVEINIVNKHVLIVEDIVDTGTSMDFLCRLLKSRGAASLKIAALVDKHERRCVPVNVDFAGFELPSGFIVGYGLDYAEKYRELPELCLVEVENE